MGLLKLKDKKKYSLLTNRERVHLKVCNQKPLINQNLKQRMSTELKQRKQWDQQETSSQPIEQEFIGYNFLRNIWGTYFHDRHQAHCEDKLDSINKIVGMMKAQIRLMIVNETKSQEFVPLQLEGHHYLLFHKLQQEFEQIKQKLQCSQMRQEEYLTYLTRQQDKLQLLQGENEKLKEQVLSLKEGKNKASQKVIELSKKIYQLERFNPSNQTSFLEQYSAITVDHQPQQEIKDKFSLFRRESSMSVFNMCEDTKSIHSSEENNDFFNNSTQNQKMTDENQPLNELNLNLNLNDKPSKPFKPKMKQSLQLRYENNETKYNQFLQEMKKVKIQTERIMDSENDHALRSKLSARRTTEPLTERPFVPFEANFPSTRQKRFKRIR